MNKKRLIITSVISIILVSILMLGSTYSIFTTSDTDEELNVYATGNLDITYTLSSENVTFTDHMPTTVEDSIWIKPYRVTITNNGTVPYMFDVILEDVTATESINSKYIMIQVGKLAPKRLSECEVVDSKYIIKEDVILLSNSSVDVDVRVWIADDIKNTEITKSFNAKLVVDGIAIYNENTDIDNTVLEANIPVNFSDYIINLYNDGSELKSVNIGGDSSNPSVSQNTKQSIMLDNNGEYRYYGATPNNYVEFNGELWRIISVSNVKSNEEDSIGSMRVKLIRDDMIDYYSWDSSETSVNEGQGVNDWSKADLMNEFNTLYYNKQSGNCFTWHNDTSAICDFSTIGLNQESRTMIGNAIYYLGAFNIDLANVRYANHYYNGERSTNVYSENPVSWKGIIALMYPSDYAYATDLDICTNVVGWSSTSDGYHKNLSCVENNWLLYGSSLSNAEWTITPFNDRGTNAFHINSVGYISGQTVGNNQVVRPVVYLKQNVVIIDGNGSKDNPYQLSIN